MAKPDLQISDLEEQVKHGISREHLYDSRCFLIFSLESYAKATTRGWSFFKKNSATTSERLKRCSSLRGRSIYELKEQDVTTDVFRSSFILLAKS